MASATTASYPVHPYKPDGGFEAAGLLALFGALALVGAILGIVASIVSQWFYLILIFPIGIGLGVGFVGQIVCERFKVRSPLLGIVAGLFAGAAAMGALHYADYYKFQGVMAGVDPELKKFYDLSVDQQTEELAGVDAETRESVEALRDQLGVQSFPDYLRWRATIGVSIKKAGRSGKGMELGYEGTLVYWLVEMLIVAGIAVAVLRQTCAEPFCRQCSNWKTTTPAGFLMTDAKTAAAALRGGKMPDIVACKPAMEAPPNHLLVSIASCPSCKGLMPIDVKLQEQTVNKKNEAKTKIKAYVTYPGAALSAFNELFTAKPASSSSPA